MIKTSRNIIHKAINERTCKTYQKKMITGIHDKRIKGVFSAYLKYKSTKKDFLFTKSTVERIDNMDISNIKPEALSFLGSKFNNEISFCFLEREKISFCYYIDVNSIKIIVFNGSNRFYSEYEMSKSIVGSAVINFKLNELDIIPNNALHYADRVGKNEIPKDFINDLIKYSKDVDFRKPLELDLKEKMDTIFLTVKAIVFLKTASVIDKDFVSDGNKFKTKNKHGQPLNSNENMIIINSFYNENINVLNPFSVGGHFRNQPTKEGVKLIYIDSFMKKGYVRNSYLENQSNETN